MLLRELGLRTGLFRRLSACFRDGRDPDRLRHSVEVVVAARAQCGAIRLMLLKLGVGIRVSVRAVRLSFGEGFPEAGLFRPVRTRVQDLPLRS